MLDFKKNIKKIMQLVENDLQEVNQNLLHSLNSEVQLAQDLAEYIFSSGGKKMRSIVILLLAKAMNYTDHKRIEASTVIEYIHAASLLHDDVVDESTLRRGKLVANKVFSNKASILVGDYIYTRAFQMIAELNSPEIIAKFKSSVIVTEMADYINSITEGEVYQLKFLNSSERITELDYYSLIEKKTAKLFEASCSLIAYLALSDYQKIDKIKQYGKYFGMVFQIVDDVLDYKPSKFIDKNQGDDLAEGKLTLPLIRLLNIADFADKEFIEDILQQDNKRDYLKKVVALLKKYNIFADCYNEAKKYAKLAVESLSDLAESTYKNALIELIDLALKRTF